MNTINQMNRSDDRMPLEGLTITITADDIRQSYDDKTKDTARGYEGAHGVFGLAFHNHGFPVQGYNKDNFWLNQYGASRTVVLPIGVSVSAMLDRFSHYDRLTPADLENALEDFNGTATFIVKDGVLTESATAAPYDHFTGYVNYTADQNTAILAQRLRSVMIDVDPAELTNGLVDVMTKGFDDLGYATIIKTARNVIVNYRQGNRSEPVELLIAEDITKVISDPDAMTEPQTIVMRDGWLVFLSNAR